MAEFNTPAAPVRPNTILAGLASCSRSDLAALIALIESVDVLAPVRQLATAGAHRIGLVSETDANRVVDMRSAIEGSDATDEVLRHRLLYGLNAALGLPTATPLTSRSASEMSSAMAVRVSERLSPVHRAAERREAVATFLEHALSYGKDAIIPPKLIPFPELVQRELLGMLSDRQAMHAAAEAAEDPAVKAALDEAQSAAFRALATGGGWAAFAQIVAAAGFGPYILAAKASAFIPLIGGPGLVSLLAVVVSPLTLAVGLAGLTWYATGSASGSARSAVAARIVVILAARGMAPDCQTALPLLKSFRQVASGQVTALTHLSSDERRQLRGEVAWLETRLASPLPAPSDQPPGRWSTRPQFEALGDAAAAVTLTAGDMLWHAVSMDPDVILAADFSRAADLADPLDFAMEANNFLATGADIALRGYVAERLVMHQMIEDGHVVRLAAQSNTPGLDLIVDGAPVQVKCGTSLSLLDNHFSTYPEIPVIANEALVEAAREAGRDWAAMVSTVPGFEIGLIEETIGSTLDNAAELLSPSTLNYAFSIGLVRGGLEVWRGAIPVTDLPVWLVLDGAGRGALSLLGGKAGAWAGLVALGPAGAVVFGPLSTGLAQGGARPLRERVIRALQADWLNEALRLGAELHGAIRNAQGLRLAAIEELSEKIASAKVTLPACIHSWLAAKVRNLQLEVLDAERRLGPQPRTVDDLQALLLTARRLAPTDCGTLGAAAALETHLAARETLTEIVGHVAKHIVGTSAVKLMRPWRT